MVPESPGSQHGSGWEREREREREGGGPATEEGRLRKQQRQMTKDEAEEMEMAPDPRTRTRTLTRELMNDEITVRHGTLRGEIEVELRIGAHFLQIIVLLPGAAPERNTSSFTLILI